MGTPHVVYNTALHPATQPVYSFPFYLCWVDLFSLFTAAAQFCGFTPDGLSSGACQRAPTASAAIWKPLLLLSQESATTMMLLCGSAICHKQMENTEFPLPRDDVVAFCTSYRKRKFKIHLDGFLLKSYLLCSGSIQSDMRDRKGAVFYGTFHSFLHVSV